MLKSFDHPAIVYPLVISAILLWWTAAFFHTMGYASASARSATPLAVEQRVEQPLPVRPIDRDEILQALQGDFSMMGALIAEWDIDAQLLQQTKPTARLSPEKLLTAHRLSRTIVQLETRQFESPYNWVCDDTGQVLALAEPPHRFLPQTELAASVLLAICPSDQIVALPARLRRQRLFSTEQLQRIALDCDRYNIEKLYAARPDVAFIAHYTQPSVIQTLREQDIALFTTTRVDSFTEVQDTVLNIGSAAGQREKAQLLTLFMEAGLLAIDNQRRDPKPKKVLYLHHGLSFWAPGPRCLNAQLAKRLDINACVTSFPGSQWQIALTSEQIALLAPDGIVVSTDQGDDLVAKILQNPVFANVPAVRHGHVYAVDEHVQTSPTQFLLLAYFDLSQVRERIR